MNEIIGNCQKSVLENWAFIATIAVPVIAILAGAVAVWQIIASAKAQRRSTAYALYQQYLTLAMENPEFAHGDQIEITKFSDRYRKYKWFVSSMLLCFEEILISCPKESDWENNIRSQLSRHTWHLYKSHSVNSGHWKKDLMRLIDMEVEKSSYRGHISSKGSGEICFKLAN
ncbi:hypothetical protein [Janthinobacterium sp. LB2P10]|uniref:hypothetical protein n=1 Tax=Janthinobacterium sp. LB2P10 TaxID=3424194 RepID=UPI003F297FAF